MKFREYASLTGPAVAVRKTEEPSGKALSPPFSKHIEPKHIGYTAYKVRDLF